MYKDDRNGERDTYYWRHREERLAYARLRQLHEFDGLSPEEVEEIKQRRREYARAYYNANAARIRKYQREISRTEKSKQYHREYYQAHRERLKEARRRYRKRKAYEKWSQTGGDNDAKNDSIS